MNKSSILKREFLKLCIPMIVCGICVGIYMKIWNVDLDVPNAFGGDITLLHTLVKSIKEFGISGLFYNPRIGAPDGATLIDVPFIDFGMALIIYLMSFFMKSPFAIAYVFYFFTFISTVATMYFLLRYLRCNYWICVMLCITYSLTPYHFYREISQLTLSNYYVVPLGILIALIVAESTFVKGIPSYCDSPLKRVVFWGSICLVGFSNIYYAFFTVLLLCVAIIKKCLDEKNISVFMNEAWTLYCMCVCILLGIMPKIIYGMIKGTNNMAGQRLPFETELYGLKIIQLFLPPTYSNVNFLGNITQLYNQTGFNINENVNSSMGILAVIGFVIACIVIIRRLLMSPINRDNLEGRLCFLATLILIMILYCTIGGIGAIFSYIVTPELRGLNRGSIYITALCLCVLGILVSKIIKNVSRRGLLVGLFLIWICSLYIEIPNLPSDWQDELKAENENYKLFFEKVEAASKDNDSIYQLPYMEFPEVPTLGKIKDYTHFLAYLYTDNLKWSYGKVKGRATSDGLIITENDINDLFMEQLIECGYDGILLDSYGYEDNLQMILDYFEDTLGLKAITSDNNRYYYYCFPNDISERIFPEKVIGKIDKKYINIYMKWNSVDLVTEKEQMDYLRGIKKDNEISNALFWKTIEKSEKIVSTDDINFIESLYQDLLERKATEAEINEWIDYLIEGESRKNVFISFLESEEFIYK